MGFQLNDAFWKTRVKGDIALYYRWTDEPTMTLYPAYPSLTIRPSGVDFPLSAAFTLADSVSGAPTPGLMKRLERCAMRLGMHPDKFTCRRIADAIVDGLPDLLEMPPFPPSSHDTKADARKEVVGEGLIKVGGKTIWNEEVTAGEMGHAE